MKEKWLALALGGRLGSRRGTLAVMAAGRRGGGSKGGGIGGEGGGGSRSLWKRSCSNFIAAVDVCLVGSR